MLILWVRSVSKVLKELQEKEETKKEASKPEVNSNKEKGKARNILLKECLPGIGIRGAHRRLTDSPTGLQGIRVLSKEINGNREAAVNRIDSTEENNPSVSILKCKYNYVFNGQSPYQEIRRTGCRQ